VRVLISIFVSCLFVIVSFQQTFADGGTKVTVPRLEMQPESFQLAPLPPKEGPGGGEDVIIIMVKK
jgi:hypothetical protein